MCGVETNLINYVNECIDTIGTNAGEITKLWEEVGKKQDKLIAGNGILIVGNVISTTDDGICYFFDGLFSWRFVAFDYEEVSNSLICFIFKRWNIAAFDFRLDP